jgi:hypothetical protein
MVTVGMLVCFLVVSSSALQCMTGVDGSSVRKVDYSPLYKFCYKYTAVNNKKIGYYGVVPMNLSKQAFAQVRYSQLLVFVDNEESLSWESSSVHIIHIFMF